MPDFLSWIPQRNPACSWSQLDDETVIVRADTGTVSVVNSVGSEIWTRCDGQMTAGNIMESMEKAFESTPETVKREVETFLRSMTEEGLLVSNV